VHARVIVIAAVVCLGTGSLRADVLLNNMFGDHMVLQQGIRNKVWGKADPGEAVTVTLGGQTHTTTAGADGSWHLFLDSVVEYGGPHTLIVKGKNTITFNDVLIGEVWLCSGQGNMQKSVLQSTDGDLVIAQAKSPSIRLLSVPPLGTQEPQWTFQGTWKVCSPDAVRDFSAVGYLFGRQLNETLGVPIGLIDNAWSGSTAEAWVSRDVLATDNSFEPLLKWWHKKEAAGKGASTSGRPANNHDSANDRPDPEIVQFSALDGNARPGNAYCGVLKPSVGYGIRGVIWYQGESHRNRAREYRRLFPALISSWRREWGLGDFPFYWAQHADFGSEQPEPVDSALAELREAQTATMKSLPNTGEAVLIDIGEGKELKPKDKAVVARRLARWALADTYKVPGVVARSPLYRAMEKQGSKLLLSFDNVDGNASAWRPFDVMEPRGFTIAGEDQKFHTARAAILPNGQITVESPAVPAPVAVRYAWADNPVCNMYSASGLPLTPFRTDSFPGLQETEWLLHDNGQNSTADAIVQVYRARLDTFALHGKRLEKASANNQLLLDEELLDKHMNDLSNIDTSKCPDEFTRAWEEYLLAYKQNIDRQKVNNRSVSLLIKAFKVVRTSGGSLIPEYENADAVEQAVGTAELKMKLVAKRHGVRFTDKSGSQ
jgi:sialate O-acetylesterase